MKHTLIVAVCLLLLTACTKKSSSTDGTSTMNATETSLIGTYHLMQTSDTTFSSTGTVVSSNTFTGYTAANYITFTSSPIATNVNANNKSCTDACVLSAGRAPQIAGASSGTEYWYFDATTDYLIVETAQFTIITNTASALTLQFKINVGGVISVSYWYFNK